MKRFYFFFCALLAIEPGFALTVDMFRLSDNTPMTALRFPSARSIDVYSQCESYLVVHYDSPDELTDLKIFSDNRNWSGGSNDRGGLVNNPPSRRVAVYWTATSAPQINISMNAQTESQWKQIRDQNDAGFSTSKSDTDIPAFPSGTTYIYLAARLNPTTATAFYSAPLLVSNYFDVVSGDSGGSTSKNGFGSYNRMFRLGKGATTMDIVYIMSAAGNADMALYDRQGKKIKQLLSGDQEAGSHVLTWNGQSDDGSPVSSGLYFVTLKMKGKVYRDKIVVIR